MSEIRRAAYKWEFRTRLRRCAFGWKSQPAIQRVKQAVVEIKQVARKDPVLAAKGAVTFIERVSPAFEQVNSSSGVVGTAMNYAIAELARAPYVRRCGRIASASLARPRVRL